MGPGEGEILLKSGSLGREHEWRLAGRLRAYLCPVPVEQSRALMGGKQQASVVVSPADGVAGPMKRGRGSFVCL